MPSKRTLLTLWALLLSLTTILGSGISPAYAHTVVVRTDPPDGSVLATSPSLVGIWFSEPVALGLTRAVLRSAHGQVWQLDLHFAAADPSHVIADLPLLEPGAYRLTWQTTADQDLHVTSGSIVFGVQQAAVFSQAIEAAQTPQPVEVTMRWISFAALAGLLGALGITLYVLPEAETTFKNQNNSGITSRLEKIKRPMKWLA